jgi:hypothetical protein
MGASQKIRRRQDCLNLENPEKCLQDLKEIVANPAETLGGDRRKIKDRRAATSYTDEEQGQICDSFRGVSKCHLYHVIFVKS